MSRDVRRLVAFTFLVLVLAIVVGTYSYFTATVSRDIEAMFEASNRDIEAVFEATNKDIAMRFDEAREEISRIRGVR